MFENGRKTIGVFIFNTNGNYQNQVCHYIAGRAEELGYNVAIFNSFGNYGDNDRYYKGELSIFELPQYEELDGIILALDTFNFEIAQEFVLDKIKKYAKCPVVSMRLSIEGASSIYLNESNIMDDIIRHVIEDHKCKDVAFMTGTKGRHDAEARLESFRRIMAENNLPIPEDRVFYGNFWRGSEKEACDLFLQRGTLPDAIICACDMMALSVIDELFARGYRVPKDTIVVGFDGLEEGVVNSPALTTVEVDFEHLARTAVDLVHKHQEDLKTEDISAKTKMILRESCGCLGIGDGNILEIRTEKHRQLSANENLEMQYSFLAIELNRLEKLEDMHKVIRRFIYNFDEFNDYYVCLQENVLHASLEESKLLDDMYVCVGLKERLHIDNNYVPFKRRELLPSELIDDTPQCFYFSPIHYEDMCFGYDAYRFRSAYEGGNMCVRWNIAIANFIQNMRMKEKMNALIAELENMYVQDVLTGLYNRRGFEKYGRMQFSQARASESMICVLAIDMDGLKPVNDIYGHHEGDSALRSVGYAIREAERPGQIAARIGGDEFEVIFPCCSEDDVKEWIKTFELSLENYNKKSQKPYSVYASCGYTVGVPTANDTIESYMNDSDDKMYKNKVENKIRRNIPFR